MKVNLLTDAPKHNLALMKLSAWHKEQGDEVLFNMPLWGGYRYASVLFDKTKIDADQYGGPAIENSRLENEIEIMKPDYDLYPVDYSLGYTYRPCFRGCSFCKVAGLNHPDTMHHTIWEFYDPKFKKICLLNNNTFMDKKWKLTFHEIWEEELTIIDENGYDLRLLDYEKAAYLKQTKFDGKIHFAWDQIEDERQIINGLELLKKFKITGHIYVLIGYDTTEEQDLHRCQKLIDFKQDPYIMPYGGTKKGKRFKRFIDSFMWRKYPTIEKAWKDYKK